ncbi:hemin ABC transporter substrate-binding protein [Thermobifida alba]|uniref:Hemin ABC transporter substrate-binding protein n=1 Tax=Thermobifida alba TaxID=53522 RepID=A0ABY4L6A0_THEAE|nr:hemin ABC transporter substrate-binding protein [Thermobifida alba]UPT21602.1 hemin ABC transporter substrate-binding protein [Thermobifida alba]
MPPHPSPRSRTRRGPSRRTALLLTLAAALTACSAPESTEDAIPPLAENRLQILEGEAAPSLPVTVDSIVPVANRTADTPTTHEQVEVTDVSRILPLNGGIAEIVYTLGLGDNVVGRDATATFAEAAELPVVTQGHDISVEGVLSLDPTLVIADTWTGPYEAIEQLRASGVTMVILDEVWSLDGMYTRITDVAEALGVPERGEQLVQRVRDQMAEVRDGLPDSVRGARVAFLYLRGSAGVYLLGGPGSGADALIAELGLEDAGTAIGLDRAFTPITSEALIEAQPDVLLVMTGGLESVGGVDGLLEIPGTAQTPAGRERRVLDYEDGLVLGFGPRTPQVLKAMSDDLTELYEGEAR